MRDTTSIYPVYWGGGGVHSLPSTHTVANQVVTCCNGLVNVSHQVKALYGGNGGGGLKGAQIAVCTIEKANALVNRMAAAEVSLRYSTSCTRSPCFMLVWVPRKILRELGMGWRLFN